MKLYKRIKLSIIHRISKIYHPVMLAGYKTKDAKVLHNVRISNTTFIDHPESLEIEDYVFIGHFNFIEASNNIRIGEGCQITNYVSITSHSSHISIRLYGRQYINEKNHIGYVKGPIKIGKYCFIGPHSLILPNTSIGNACLIHPYSKVQGDFPDFSIIAGDPAKIIGNTKEMDKKYLDEHPLLRKYDIFV